MAARPLAGAAGAAAGAGGGTAMGFEFRSTGAEAALPDLAFDALRSVCEQAANETANPSATRARTSPVEPGGRGLYPDRPAAAERDAPIGAAVEGAVGR